MKMMTQEFLAFQYLKDKTATGLTSFAGLPLYVDLAISTGLLGEINKTLQTKTQGWTDSQIILSLLLLNIAGGDSVGDIEGLESDEGLRTLLLKTETQGMKRQERRAYERRFRKLKQRAFPSESVIHRYLEQFHQAGEESKRQEGIAFIPAANDNLQKLIATNAVLLNFAQTKNPCTTATLDQDATLSETHKRTAFYCYKKYKAYQPFNTYWHEQKLLVHSEFRDGNVPAGFEQLRLLQASLQLLPAGVSKVLLRSDSAGYQENLLRYCAEGKDERFEVIEFAIACKVTAAFKQAVAEVKVENWQPLYKEENGLRIKTDQEFAEVCFVPTWVALDKEGPDYRYVAIRERMTQQTELPGIEPVQKELPFQTMQFNKDDYKLFGLVTNRKLPGNDLIAWHRERCGDSEKVHSMEKSDFAGGQFPSAKFGANAAWWQTMLLAFNLNQLFKQFALPDAFKTKRMKALRFHIIQIAGRVIQHARGLFIQLSGGLELAQLISDIRKTIRALATAPPAATTG